MRKILWYILSLYLVSSPVFAISGVSSDPSINPYAARQLGMGSAAVAFSDDANGIFSNPAGLAGAVFPQVSVSSRKLVLDEVQYALMDWSVPTDWGSFGIGYTSLSTTGSLPTILDPSTGRIITNPSAEADSYLNQVIALSYAKNIRADLSLGANLKLFHQDLSGSTASSANATGFDLGVIYTPKNWLTLGANLQNVVEGTLNWQNGASDKLGGFYKLGAKFNVMGSKEALFKNTQNLWAGFDYDLPHNSLAGSGYHFGLEYFPQSKIALRTGFDQRGFSAGIGFISSGFRFDYAFVSNPNLPGDTPHYFTFSYIGEKTLTVSEKSSRKIPQLTLLSPQNYFITSSSEVELTAKAFADVTVNRQKVWTVPAISQQVESEEVFSQEKMVNISVNGVSIEASKKGLLLTAVPLQLGKNKITLLASTASQGINGSTVPSTTLSAEVVGLRYHLFSDLPPDYWTVTSIAYLTTLGIIGGYPDNTFQPDKGISRAELVALLARCDGVSIEVSSLEASPFKDVRHTNWALPYVIYGASHKLVNGYPDSTFKPHKILSRAEGIAILARYSGISGEAVSMEAELISAEAKVPFTDLPANFWANKYIAGAKKAGMLKHLEGKEFTHWLPFTRAEACEVLSHTPQVKKKVEGFWNQ